MKIPQDEVVVAFGEPEIVAARRIDFEKDLAIDQESEKLDPWKTVLATQFFDPVRRGEGGQHRCNFRIANPEQRAGARRFQHHVIAAPPHIREPRQGERVGVAQLRRLRPIIGNLRLDDDQVLAGSRARPRRYSNRPRLANRRTNRSISLSTLRRAGRKGGERQAGAQPLRALRSRPR